MSVAVNGAKTGHGQHDLALPREYEIPVAPYFVSVHLWNNGNTFLGSVIVLLLLHFFFCMTLWEITLLLGVHLYFVYSTLGSPVHKSALNFIKDDVSSSLTFIPWPRLSRELISRPSLQACKQEITFWLSILPGRIVRLARLPWKYWANLGLVTSPPAREEIKKYYN